MTNAKPLTNERIKAMKRFHVTVVVKTLEVYQVDAQNEDDAEENWADGTLIDTDDGVLENEILSVEEVKP
jgi:hypothetical protein